MSVAPNAQNYSADFTVHPTTETSKSSLFVIANGIAPTPVSVAVQKGKRQGRERTLPVKG